jgi:HEPN domain-containing protein
MLQKARRDARHAARFAADAEVDDEHIGFCCQQAVEKAIKSVLSQRRIRYRRTHDLSELIELTKATGIDVPDGVLKSVTLTPFAVEFRYDDLPDADEPAEAFDRADAVRIAAAAVAWADALVGGE